MMDPIFIVAIVFLVLGGAFGGYVVIHKEIVIKPLEIEEHEIVEKMSCDELSKKHESGQYWSFNNWKLGNSKICGCPNPPPQCTGGGGH
ncbi:MAG: hypothetical protein FJ354_03655 [Thaumarchaeota archaeon]|nr:hypothetical protein [Nitrososphaerota archaeon]